MKGLPPQAPGSGFGALGYALRHLTPTGRPVGGSGALTDALASAVRVAGGSIRTGVAAIRCSAERVDGVELDDGERIAAPLVVGAGDPRTLFIDLLDATSPAARRLQTRWRSRGGRQGYEGKIDAIIDVLPRARGIDDEHLRTRASPAPRAATPRGRAAAWRRLSGRGLRDRYVRGGAVARRGASRRPRRRDQGTISR